MDRRTKEYKEWKIQDDAERKAKRDAKKAEAAGFVQSPPPREVEVTDVLDQVLPPSEPQPAAPEALPVMAEVTTSSGLSFSVPLSKPGIVASELKEEVPPEKKAPTRPWERRNAARPWRRDYFDLKVKRKGFHCRFVDPDNVESRQQRGYQVASPDHYGGLVDNDIRDTRGLGKVITRHGMVLMEIPDEGAEAYRQHNRDMIAARQKSARAELEKAGKESGTGVTVRSEGIQ
jgi:hypothetical protein